MATNSRTSHKMIQTPVATIAASSHVSGELPHRVCSGVVKNCSTGVLMVASFYWLLGGVPQAKFLHFAGQGVATAAEQPRRFLFQSAGSAQRCADHDPFDLRQHLIEQAL